MNAHRIWKWLPALLVAATVGLAYGKLPAPSAEQKAKAAAAKEKAAGAAKKQAEALGKAQDRAAEYYKKSKDGGAMTVKTGAPMMKK